MTLLIMLFGIIRRLVDFMVSVELLTSMVPKHQVFTLFKKDVSRCSLSKKNNNDNKIEKAGGWMIILK